MLYWMMRFVRWWLPSEEGPDSWSLSLLWYYLSRSVAVGIALWLIAHAPTVHPGIRGARLRAAGVIFRAR